MTHALLEMSLFFCTFVAHNLRQSRDYRDLSKPKTFKELLKKYEIISNVIHDVRTNEGLLDEPMLIYVGLVHEYLHIIAINVDGKSLSVVVAVDKLYDIYFEVRGKLTRELEYLKSCPIVITDRVSLIPQK